MAKIKSVYVCSECGYESPKWYGKCPGCNQWNTMDEKISETANSAKVITSPGHVMALGDITEDVERRISTGNNEFDRVLGGGIVIGSLVLLSGDPVSVNQQFCFRYVSILVKNVKYCMSAARNQQIR